jgi:plasmid maintenance system antidote protein VapI
MNLKNIIKETCGSVESAANKLQISRQHLNEITNGSAFPSRKLAIRIEKITNGQIPIVVFGYANIKRI